jgi:hypothetical protein
MKEERKERYIYIERERERARNVEEAGKTYRKKVADKIQECE